MAGPDQIVTSNNIGQATVTLNGTGSSPAGLPFTMKWAGPGMNATTPTVTSTLGLGNYIFTFTVTDSLNQASSASTHVTVQLPTGASGPAGPAGSTGATGPQGPAGAQVPGPYLLLPPGVRAPAGYVLLGTFTEEAIKRPAGAARIKLAIAIWIQPGVPGTEDRADERDERKEERSHEKKR
jgi:hypothetical protein